MKTRTHPTHHQGFRPERAAWAVGIALAGVFVCVFALPMKTRESPLRFAVKASALWAGALAFAGGTIVGCAIEIRHRFTRCASCGRLLVRRRVDWQKSYYPCRRCQVTWTCPCRKGGRSTT
jgi:hypothetical protein